MRFKQFLTRTESFFKKGKQGVLTFLFLAILVNVVFFEFNSDIIIFGLLGLYLLASKIYKFNSKVAFLICFIILSILLLEYLVGSTSFYTEKAAVWLFIFILTGIIQELFLKNNEAK